jgi:poly(3-hydroxybutyrate) depolymerase
MNRADPCPDQNPERNPVRDRPAAASGIGAHGKEEPMRISLLAALPFCAMALPSSGAAQDVEDLCTRATMTAAVGTITAETFGYGGTDRFACTYTPSSLPDGDRHPLLIALHGGSGNASQMMEDDHGIIAEAEARGYVAVFPNGLPRRGCDALPCLDNNWAEPDNVFFIAELIDRALATGLVREDRIHLVGFSGGAALIYDIVATPGFPHAIHSVATVAGAFGLYHAERDANGFVVTQLQEGTPVSALLVQGGQDTRLPAAGGLDETTREAHVSFRTKVDYWRLLTGTESTPGQPVDMAALDPTAPADLVALRYSQGGQTVVEALDPGLPHGWPAWNVMALASELFEHD